MELTLLQKLTTPLSMFMVTLLSRAIFSFLETSITALRLFKLKEMARSYPKYESLFYALEKNTHRVLITILIANSLADVTTAALATHITEVIFSSLSLSGGLGFSLGIGVASLAIIIFGEILPKNLAKEHGEHLFPRMLWLINLIFYILYPVVTVLIRVSDAVIYRFGQKSQEGSGDWISSEREIQFLINYVHEKGLIEPEKTAMLLNIFELGRTPVKEIMVPATDIISLNVNTPIKDALRIFSEHQFTRLPVYQDTMDNVIGMVHQKDVFVILSRHEAKPLKDIVRTIMFVPETLKVNQLLTEFRKQQMHIAIVLNEHGIVTGLITLEDVLEEIVGEISDEHKPTSEKVVPLKQGGWLVDASVALDELGEILGIVFETEDSVTLGGFLTERLQHLPKKGERVVYGKYCFQIQKASIKRVQQVLVFEENAQLL